MGEDGKGKSVKEIMEIEVAGKKKGKIAKIMEERTDEAEAQYREAKLKRLVAEEEARIKKVQSDAGTVATPQNQVQTLFAGRKPEEVKEILDSLEPQHIQKLALIANAMNPNQQSMLMQMLRQPDRSINDTIQLIKTVIELREPRTTSSSSTKDVIEAFKVGLEAAKSKESSTSKESPIKLAMEYIKPFYETMSEKDRQFYNAQIQNVQSQIIDPIAYLEKIKEVAPSLGFVPASQRGQPNLEMEKMHIDHDRWKFEQEYKQRKEYQEMQNKRASEKERTKLIRDIAIPALKKMGPAIDAAVKAGQRKIAGVGTGGTATKQMATAFLCPECAKKGVETLIDVADMPDVAKCSVCGTEFPKQK